MSLAFVETEYKATVAAAAVAVAVAAAILVAVIRANLHESKRFICVLA